MNDFHIGWLVLLLATIPSDLVIDMVFKEQLRGPLLCVPSVRFSLWTGLCILWYMGITLR